VAGALYLAWLGIGALRASGGGVQLDTVSTGAAGILRSAREGFLIAFLNPKIAVFFLALFSQFVHPHMPATEHATLALTATVIDGGWYALVALALSHSSVLVWLRRRAHWVDRATGAVLLLLATVTLLRLLLT
jgi:threonine/homoserine/homoserine lactone efflux protein